MSLTAGQLRHRLSTAAVLEFAWDAGAFRADHVMAALGLTRSTALTALGTLIELGLISELPSAGPEDGYRLGRPARRFELRAEAGVLIGIDAGEHQYTATATDLAGRVLGRQRLELRGLTDSTDPPVRELDPGERRTSAFRAIDGVLEATGRTRADVIGVGVGIPAPVDADGGSPAHPSGFWQRMDGGLQAVLADQFPAVRVENDAALAAVCEGNLGEARGYDDFIAILVGRRLGSGVFLDGRLVRGAHGGVGELEGFTYVVGIGNSYGIGVRAERWLRGALDAGRIPADHPWAQLGESDLTAEAALAVADLDDPVSRPLLVELGDKLGRICNVLSRFYDPGVIVVCGAVAGALGDAIEIARGHVEAESELPPPAIVASQFGGDVVSLGAVSAAREAARAIALTLFTERYHG